MEQIVELILLISVLIPSIIMIVMGLVLKHKAPGNINYLYGYRTSKSMASQEAWDMSQTMLGNMWTKLGVITILFCILVVLLMPLSSTVSLGLMVFSVIMLTIPIIFIEKKLKEL